jgi:3D (Asp-Asp-Asp) domain-containing protein
MQKKLLVAVALSACISSALTYKIVVDKHESVHTKNKEVIARLSTTVSRANATRDTYRTKALQLQNEVNELTAHINELTAHIETLRQVTEKYSVDTFQVTAYSPYDNVSGMENNGNPNTTATGTKPRPGTIAVDPKVIPYGSKIIIIYEDGTVEYGVAEDCGGLIKGNIIDVFRQTYKEAVKHGRREATVIWYND